MSKKLSSIMGSFFRNNNNDKEVTDAEPVSSAAETEEEYQLRRKAVIKAEKKIERAAAARRRELVCSQDVSIESIHGGQAFRTEVNAAEDTASDERLLQMLRDRIGKAYIPDTHITAGEFSFFRNRFNGHRDIDKSTGSLIDMYIDWLFFCKDLGYDMDDYFDYEFYEKDHDERLSFVSASFRDNIRRHLDPEPGILQRKADFLKYFSGYIKRDWLDCSECSEYGFISFAKRHPVFFCKAEKGFGAEGLQKLSPSEDELAALYEDCRARRCVIEEPIVQHASLSRFNPDTVNSVRVVTIADAEDRIVIANASMRFGRRCCFADNYHQGGLVAKIDPDKGVITGDAIDRSGAHFAAHPDTGEVFNGSLIPFWDKVRNEVAAAALSCRDKDRSVGWDLTVTEDGEVDFIEGNSRPGFAVLQAPDMQGLRERYVKILSGLVSEEELMDAGRGYWRKWKLNID